MKNFLKIMLICFTIMLLTGCKASNENLQNAFLKDLAKSEVVQIELSDTQIKVNDTVLSETAVESLSDDSAGILPDTHIDGVYIARDIVYYEEGHDFIYGEGKESDAHSKEDAEEHIVVHIGKPGVYSISGTLSKGQIAIDLGEEAKEDPDAVVTLILNGADITCEVAPAVIFYNVYECGNKDAESATKDVNTSEAGANVVIADDTVNTVNGSYVARIYKPDSVILSEDGTEVEDAKKLHKYDGAFYSKMSMNIYGESENSGQLVINAENEGLDSEMHLTINGGNIDIFSGNDGINTNEDGVSVTTINGGNLSVSVVGSTGEGDGIDSNGWLVINGGTVMVAACSDSADAGIDSDMGIHINGGTVIASGHMLDHIEADGQNYVVFQFATPQTGTENLELRDEDGNLVAAHLMHNSYSVIVFSAPELEGGRNYTLWSGDKQFAGIRGGNFMQADFHNFGNGNPPENGMPGENMDLPEGERPDKMEFPEGTPPERPEDMKFPENGVLPPEDGMTPPEKPENMEEFTFQPGGEQPPTGIYGAEPSVDISELSTEFEIQEGGNFFTLFF